MGTAAPDAQHLLDEGAHLEVVSEGLEVVGESPLTHGRGVVVLAGSAHEFARSVRPEVALVEEEPATEVRPRGKFVDGEHGSRTALRQIDRVVDLDGARGEPRERTELRRLEGSGVGDARRI